MWRAASRLRIPGRSIQRPTNGAGRTPASERGDPVCLAGRGHEGTQRPTRQDHPAIVKRRGPHDAILRYGLTCLGLFRGHRAEWRLSTQIRRGRPTRLRQEPKRQGRQRTPTACNISFSGGIATGQRLPFRSVWGGLSGSALRLGLPFEGLATTGYPNHHQKARAQL
jgi:hypothetical protein